MFFLQSKNVGLKTFFILQSKNVKNLFFLRPYATVPSPVSVGVNSHVCSVNMRGKKNVPHGACLNANLFPSMFTEEKTTFIFPKFVPPIFFPSSKSGFFFATELVGTPKIWLSTQGIPTKFIKVREFQPAEQLRGGQKTRTLTNFVWNP